VSALRQIGKRVRGSQPFNYIATSLARAITTTVGWQPEFLPRHLHKVGRVTCTLPNGRSFSLWSRGDDWVSNRVFWYGWKGYEPETVGVFAALAANASCTIDIGAYVGFFALVAAQSNPSAMVHAFEPMPPIFARLQNNIRMNGFANVAAHEMAVGDASGAADFYFATETELPTSSSLSPTFTPDASDLTSRSVRVVRLDDFVREESIGRVDLMKIDTETTELSVLRGATEMLQRDHPHIVCEVLHDRADKTAMSALLKSFGYAFYLLTPDGPQRQNEIAGHPEFLNYLFTTMTPDELKGRITS
jgi:FkbM family methyltransferase